MKHKLVVYATQDGIFIGNGGYAPVSTTYTSVGEAVASIRQDQPWYEIISIDHSLQRAVLEA